MPAGRITVLLGPNGAGKTTAIRTITGAFAPDGGTVRVFGLDPAVAGAAVRPRCGVVSAKPALYDRLSGLDNLRYSAELYGLGRGPSVDARIEEAAARFGIEAALDDQVGGYSTGMKTRLALARSVLHRSVAAALRRADLGPRPGVVARGPRAHPRDDRRRDDGGDVHPPAPRGGGSGRPGRRAPGRAIADRGFAHRAHPRYWPEAMVRIGADDPAALDALATHAGVVRYEREAGIAVVHLDDVGRVPDLVAALTGAGARVTRVEPHEPIAGGSLLRRAAGLGADPPRRRRRELGLMASATTGTSEGFRWGQVRTVARTDLKQLAQARDYWIPMLVLGAIFFVFVPTVLLFSITQDRRRRGGGADLAGARGPPREGPAAAARRRPRRAGPPTRWRSTCSHRSRWSSRSPSRPPWVRRPSSASASGAPASSSPTPPPASARSSSASWSPACCPATSRPSWASGSTRSSSTRSSAPRSGAGSSRPASGGC